MSCYTQRVSLDGFENEIFQGKNQGVTRPGDESGRDSARRAAVEPESNSVGKEEG